MTDQARFQTEYNIIFDETTQVGDSLLDQMHQAVTITAEALFAWYKTSQLEQFTHGNNSRQYPQALTQSTLFTLMIGSLTVKIGAETVLDDSGLTVKAGDDLVNELIYLIAKKMDSKSEQYGTKSLEKEGIVDLKTGEKVSYEDANGTWVRSNVGMIVPPQNFGGDNASDEWADTCLHWVTKTIDAASGAGEDRQQKMDQWLYVMMAAHLANTSIPQTADERMSVSKYFFDKDGFGYGFEHLAKTGDALGFGRSQIDFTAWEMRRGVLNTLDNATKPGSKWWRAVNGQLMRDMEEGRLIHEANFGRIGTSESANRWLDYLGDPSAQHWYLAHDYSIVEGYVRYEDLAYDDIYVERVLMSGVLTRLLLAQVMVTALEDQALGRSTMARVAEFVLQELALPQEFAVKLITDIVIVYPDTYPLSELDQNEVLLMTYVETLVLSKNSFISYADVTPPSLRAETRKRFREDIDDFVRGIVDRLDDDLSIKEKVQAIRNELRGVEDEAIGCWQMIAQLLGLGDKKG